MATGISVRAIKITDASLFISPHDVLSEKSYGMSLLLAKISKKQTIHINILHLLT
jgi:hypothetical protein